MIKKIESRFRDSIFFGKRGGVFTKRILDKGFYCLTMLCTFCVITLMCLIIGHMIKESIPAFQQVGMGLFDLNGEWRPVSNHPQFSLIPAIAGTIYVSVLAVVISLFFGICCSFFLSFCVHKKIVAGILSFIDLVAGIPSVIFGFIGLTVLVKWFQEHLDMAAGQCILAAGIVLSVMLLPFIVSNCNESISMVRRRYEASALALGFSKEAIIIRIFLPSMRNSIVAAIMMALGRALGETMAVMMVIGNSSVLPKLMGRGITIASLTALEMGSIEYGSVHLSALYTANVALLVILIVLLALGTFWKRRDDADES